jgi:hypothetical protein
VSDLAEKKNDAILIPWAVNQAAKVDEVSDDASGGCIGFHV